MTILANSRYANSSVVAVDKDGADVAVIVPSPAVAYSFSYVNHQVADGERPDTLAYQYYTDPTLWWRIAQANPEIMYWDSVPAGTIIRIPQL